VPGRGDTVVGQMAAGWVGMAGRLDRKDGNLVQVAAGRSWALGAGGIMRRKRGPRKSRLETGRYACGFMQPQERPHLRLRGELRIADAGHWCLFASQRPEAAAAHTTRTRSWTPRSNQVKLCEI